MSKMKKVRRTQSLYNGIKESVRIKSSLDFRHFDFGCSDEIEDLREQTNLLCGFMIISMRLLCLFFTLGFFILFATFVPSFLNTISYWISLLLSYICIVYLWTFITREKQKKIGKMWWKIALFCIAFSLPLMSFYWSFWVTFAFAVNVLMVSFCILMSGLKAKRKDTSDALKLKMLTVWIFLMIIGGILILLN